MDPGVCRIGLSRLGNGDEMKEASLRLIFEINLYDDGQLLSKVQSLELCRLLTIIADASSMLGRAMARTCGNLLSL